MPNNKVGTKVEVLNVLKNSNMSYDGYFLLEQKLFFTFNAMNYNLVYVDFNDTAS